MSVASSDNSKVAREAYHPPSVVPLGGVEVLTRGPAVNVVMDGVLNTELKSSGVPL